MDKNDKKKKKNAFLLICFWVIVFTCMFSLTGFAKPIRMKSGVSYQIDMDGDRKKETVRMRVEDKDIGTVSIYVNNKKLLRSSKWIFLDEVEDCYLCDIQKNDKNKEIVIISDESISVWRYRKGKLIKYAIGDGEGDLFEWNIFYPYGRFEAPGNGVIKILQLLYAKKGSGNGQEMFVNVALRVNPGTISIDQKSYHKLDRKMQSRLARSQYLETKGKTTYVYKYPREYPNELLFTLKKGIKYQPVKLKFTPKYTFMKIKLLKSGKTGWIGINTNTINTGYHSWEIPSR